MAAVSVDRLEIVHFDESRTVFEKVTYCAWRDGVTVYQGGEEIARYEDVLTASAYSGAQLVAAM